MKIPECIRPALTSDRMIPAHLSIVRSFDGCHEIAVLFGQIYYWTERTDDEEGWFYKSADEFWEEICLSPCQISRWASELDDLGLIERKRRPIRGQGNPYFYRLTEAGFQWLCDALSGKPTDYRRKSKPRKPEVQETSTSENPNFSEPEVQETSTSRRRGNLNFLESEETSTSSTNKITTKSTTQTTTRAPAREGACQPGLLGDETPDAAEEKPKKGKPKKAARTADYTDEFEREFWDLYPLKDGKFDAFESFKAIKQQIEQPEDWAALKQTFQAAISRAKQTSRWRRGIIPLPATWLNQRRWEDAGVSGIDPLPNGGASHFAEHNAETLSRINDPNRTPSAVDVLFKGIKSYEHQQRRH